MNNSLVRMFKFAALMAVGGTALMQAAQQATFHLSVVTHWGRSVLQPGDYKMYLPDQALGQNLLKVEGAGKTVYIFPLVSELKKRSTSSRLDLSEIDGEYFVHDYCDGILGKQFTFQTPKTPRREQAAAKHASSSVVAN